MLRAQWESIGYSIRCPVWGRTTQSRLAWIAFLSLPQLKRLVRALILVSVYRAIHFLRIALPRPADPAKCVQLASTVRDSVVLPVPIAMLDLLLRCYLPLAGTTVHVMLGTNPYTITQQICRVLGVVRANR